ncbi:MAG: AraC family transcriptional regulator [Caulobacteraceae bacterium]|nr:AraC family transcriptional regulator [Caulobacteraceae bacterium]
MEEVSASRSWLRTDRAGPLGDAEVVSARFTTHRFPVHAHLEHEIGLVTEGACVFQHGRAWFVAPRGSLIVLGAHEEHTGRALDGAWRQVNLYLRSDQLQAWLGTPDLVPRRPTLTDPVAASLLRSLAGLVRVGAEALAIQSTFVALGQRLMGFRAKAEAPSSTRLEGQIRYARRRLDDEPVADLDLAQLASETGLSPLALMRGFRRSVGCTPYVYRTTRRLNLAKSAIRSGQPLAGIAADSGFCDQSHLTRVFRRWFGVTPGEYQKSVA